MNLHYGAKKETEIPEREAPLIPSPEKEVEPIPEKERSHEEKPEPPTTLPEIVPEKRE